MGWRRALVASAALWALWPGTPAADDEVRVLVFSKTAGFRHASIPEGIALVQSLGATHGFGVDATEDAGAFTATNLAQYAAVVWLSTSGDVLNAAQQVAFEAYLQAGHGYVGVHSAASTERSWPWYGALLGNDAWLDRHPTPQAGMLTPRDPNHPSTRNLPATFSLLDEWYDFQSDPTPAVNVLLTVDEASYGGARMGLGTHHPISWYRTYDGGRAWYTALGHATRTLSDANFAEHLRGGIVWAALGDAEPHRRRRAPRGGSAD